MPHGCPAALRARDRTAPPPPRESYRTRPPPQQPPPRPALEGAAAGGAEPMTGVRGAGAGAPPGAWLRAPAREVGTPEARSSRPARSNRAPPAMMGVRGARLHCPPSPLRLTMARCLAASHRVKGPREGRCAVGVGVCAAMDIPRRTHRACIGVPVGMEGGGPSGHMVGQRCVREHRLKRCAAENEPVALHASNGVRAHCGDAPAAARIALTVLR